MYVGDDTRYLMEALMCYGPSGEIENGQANGHVLEGHVTSLTTDVRSLR